MPTDPNETNKIGIATTNPYWAGPDYLDTAIKTYGITDRTSEIEKDIDNLKNMVLHQQGEIRRLTIESEERAYQVQQVSKDLRTVACEIPKPNQIANLALDKLFESVELHKKVLTDKQGVTTEMIDLEKLKGIIAQIRKVVNKNDNDKNN